MHDSHAVGRAVGPRRRRARLLAAAAVMTAAGLAGVSAPGADAAVAPRFQQSGLQIAAVGTDGHLSNFNLSAPSDLPQEHGPILAHNGVSTAGVSIAARKSDKTFEELLPAKDGTLWFGNNDGFSRVSGIGLLDANATPAIAIDRNGNYGFNVISQGRDVLKTPSGTVVQHIAPVKPGTGSALAPVVGTVNGFVSTWIQQDGFLMWSDEHASATHGETLIRNFFAAPGATPAIASFLGHWRIDVPDTHGELWEVTDAHPTNAVDTGLQISGSAAATTLVSGNFALAFADTGGNLWVQGVPVGQKVLPGTSLSITAGVNADDWVVAFEGLDHNPHVVGSSGGTAVLPMNGAEDPRIGPGIAFLGN